MLFMFLAYAALIACVAIIAMKFIGYLKTPPAPALGTLSRGA